MPEIIFNGPDGRLEGRYHDSLLKQENEYANAPAALVLHPHPLHGGTMNNKIVYQMYHAFARAGFSVLRFNFRGVGRSQGCYDEGAGELSDAAAALDWLQRKNQTASSYWVSGFSFGAWIALQLLMRRPEVNSYLAVSPPAGKFDFSFISPCPAHGLILQGSDDEISLEKDVEKLAAKLSAPPMRTKYKVIEGADHFYNNKMDDFTSELDAYIASRMAESGSEDLFSPAGHGESKRRRIAQDQD